MSPKVKGYTDIYDILTYTGTETHVSFGLFIPEIHFFRQGLKNFLPPKGLRAICLLACLLAVVLHKDILFESFCHSLSLLPVRHA